MCTPVAWTWRSPTQAGGQQARGQEGHQLPRHDLRMPALTAKDREAWRSSSSTRTS
ncbi:hypothetical protein QJS66_17470 [Kocuria rhizophila]|nr:hypothetical protein QJS66_17470 [Kocuria rhizophila]